jgi:hypothetical protein
MSRAHEKGEASEETPDVPEQPDVGLDVEFDIKGPFSSGDDGIETCSLSPPEDLLSDVNPFVITKTPSQSQYQDERARLRKLRDGFLGSGAGYDLSLHNSRVCLRLNPLGALFEQFHTLYQVYLCGDLSYEDREQYQNEIVAVIVFGILQPHHLTLLHQRTVTVFFTQDGGGATMKFHLISCDDGSWLMADQA